MASFTIKVPNDDEGEDLGEYQSDHLPRVGDSFTLWHPRVCPKKGEPFCGVVTAVAHEVFHKDHPYAPLVEPEEPDNVVVTTVWLVEEHGAVTLYCDCSAAERAEHGATAGECDRCGHARAET